MPRVKTIAVSLAAFAGATALFASEAFAQQPPPGPVAPAPAPAPTVIVVQQQSSGNPGLVAGGGALIGLGATGLLVGVIVTIAGAATANACDEIVDPATGTTTCSGGAKGVLIGGIVTDILSVGMMAGGIAMVVIGGQSSGTAQNEDPLRTALTPTVKLGLGNASLSWSF